MGLLDLAYSISIASDDVLGSFSLKMADDFRVAYCKGRAG